MGAKGVKSATLMLLHINTQRKSMQKKIQLHEIQHVSLLDQLENQKLPAFILKSGISFSCIDRQNKFQGDGLLHLLILNLKLLHLVQAIEL